MEIRKLYLWISLAAFCCVVFPSTAPAQLRLEEQRVTLVPDTFRISAVANLGNSRVGLLSYAHYVIVATGDDLVALGHGILERPVGIGFNENNRRIEVIDAMRREIVSFQSAEQYSSRRVTVPGAFESAVRIASGWYIGGRDEMGIYRIFFADDRGGVRQVHTRPSPPQGLVRPSVRLTTSGIHLNITAVDAPFATHVVDTTGHVVTYLNPLQSSTVREELGYGQDERVRWASLPVVAVGSGFLQIIERDLGQSYVLVTFDKSGHVLRVRNTTIPLAFGASDAGESLLFGVRWLEGQELVTYRWSWEAESSTTRTEKPDEN